MPEPTAKWNPARGVWETGAGQDRSLFCAHSEPFLAIWPSSRPRSAPVTSDSGSSSLPGLPTPLASDAGPRGGTTGYGLRDWSRGLPLLGTPRSSDGIQHPLRTGVENARGRLEAQVSQLLTTPASSRSGNNQSASPGAAVRPSLDYIAELLPTPSARDSGRGAGYTDREGRPLSETVHRLLPTPRATDGEKGGLNQRGSSGDLMLPSAVASLLPTPQARDGDSSSRSMSTPTARRRFDQGKRNLDDAIALLPTPTAMDSKSSGKGQSGTHGTTLTDAARECGGGPTDPPSPAGKPSSDDPHQTRP